MCSYFVFYCLFFVILLQLVFESVRLDLDNGNYEIGYSAFGLQHQIFAMASQDLGCARADELLDNALLGFDKMPSSWTAEEKQRTDRKAPISNLSSSVKSNTAGRSEGENRCCVVVKVGAVVHDENLNH